MHNDAVTTAGIPFDAVDFYAELALNNNREWWAANAERYRTSVKAPLTRLLDDLAPRFGDAHLFRPHRDVRFSADKRPYKSEQGGLCLAAPGVGHYLRMNADGLSVGGGYYPSGRDQLARQRAAIDSAGSGTELAQIVQALTADGFEVGGDQVATRPRGVPADHPRLDLMRRQSLVVLKTFGEPAWLPTADVVERVAEQWARITPLVEWLVTNVGPSLEPRR